MPTPTPHLTPLSVMLLALLREDDMHPYEMIRLMRIRRDDRIIPLTNGTIYHTVERLERAGLVTEVGVDRDGNRPERTTYALTDAGSAAVEAWVRHELPRIDRPLEFRVALSEAHELDRATVAQLLTERRDGLEADAARLQNEVDTSRRGGTPEQYLIEVDRHLALAAADISWLDAFLVRLQNPDLAWGADPSASRSDRYLSQRKAARL
ncbi:PadR family transcriptional regulator [Microbacterium sp. cx-59]|uniref:PadR family transcriptional regulator n=1 Tax=Microbacterium sp. cx-59 TaxID=2891207 RepID=UPI0027DF5C94|nr:PadR family transcriptional regulator [Microbacterium sp. cx-59]